VIKIKLNLKILNLWVQYILMKHRVFIIIRVYPHILPNTNHYEKIHSSHPVIPIQSITTKPQAITVKLDPVLLKIASIVGALREASAIIRGQNLMYGAQPEGAWDRYIEGCLTEIAVAWHLNVFWHPKIGTPTPGDVGHYEVRTSKRDNNCLLVRPSDSDEAAYIFVTGQHGDYKIHGWIYGKEAKQPQFLSSKGNDRPPAYFVPKAQLHRMSTLPKSNG